MTFIMSMVYWGGVPQNCDQAAILREEGPNGAHGPFRENACQFPAVYTAETVLRLGSAVLRGEARPFQVDPQHLSPGFQKRA